MRIKPILRIFFVKTKHGAIARNFGNDGSRGNNRNFLVAFYNSFVRDTFWQIETAVKQYL